MPTGGSSDTPWIMCHTPSPHATLHLYALPHAGGGASLYRSWPKRLPTTIEVRPLQLPGRENRVSETPYDDPQMLLDALEEVLIDRIDRPYVLFGHSMGGILAFELAHRLQRAGVGDPEHLFVSGASAPHYERSLGDTPPKDQSKDELVERLRKYGGMPADVLDNENLLDFLLPTLRADFQLNHQYTYEEKPPLQCPLSVFGGKRTKETSDEEFADWEPYTEGAFSVHMIDGGHFFVKSHQDEVIGTLLGDLDLDAHVGPIGA